MKTWASPLLTFWFSILLPTMSANNAPPEHDTCVHNGQCLNGGVCQTPDGEDKSYKHCHCPDGFGGSRCEHYCPLACQNGGHCFRNDLIGTTPVLENDQDLNPNDFTCKCLGLYMGDLCEIPYENCADGSQCLYGGVCRKRESQSRKTSYCQCPVGYGGPSCEIVHVEAQDAALLPFSNAGRAVFSLFLTTLSIAALALALYVYRKRHYRAVSTKEHYGFVARVDSDKRYVNVV